MAEDFKGYEGDNEELKKLTDGYLAILPQNGLTLSCKELGLDTVNLEYRFARIAAISPLKDSNLKPDERFEKSAKTTIFARAIVEEFDDMVKLVSQFDDGTSLKEYYNEHLKAVCMPNDKILNEIRVFSGRIGDYIKNRISPEKHLRFARLLLLWDSRLLDLKAIHEIVNHAHKKKLFIFTGSAHSYLIGQALENYLGYKKKCVIGKERPCRYRPWVLDVESNPGPSVSMFSSNKSIPGQKMEPSEPLTNDELSILLEDFKKG